MAAEHSIATSHSNSIWPGKLTLVLLCLTVALPMLAAYWIYESGTGIPEGTINKGDLIIPATSLQNLPVNDQQQNPANWLDGHKWRLITVTDNGCDSSCVHNLYVSHQVHVRLAKDAERVQRYLVVVANNPDFAQVPEIAQSDSGLTILTVTADAWRAEFGNTNYATPKNGLMVVDQAGFAMMSYQETHTGSDLLDDLKRLLKYSYE